MDEAALRGWLGTDELVVERLREGHSNLTYLLHAPGRELVLRRPPEGPLLPTAHDVVREHRVLTLLQGTGVRVPAVVGMCEDPAVIGAPFYVMERVEGEVVRLEVPAWLGPDQRWEVGLDLAAALAELHAAPFEPFVAAGIGRPSGYLARQVTRWSAQRELAHVRELPDHDVVRDWLQEHLPAEGRPAVVHGDYKLDNVLLHGPRVAAIVDWEMATVGDPLADLGYLLAMWVEPGESVPFLGDASPTAQPGWPSREQIAEHYAALSGRSMTDLRFYVTLAVWKLAVLLEGSFARYLAGTTDDPFFTQLEVGVPALLARAREHCCGA